MAQTRETSTAEWFVLARAFIKREYISVVLSASLGALCAGLFRLLSSDHSFDALFVSNYLPSGRVLDDPSRYLPYILAVAILVFAMLAIRMPGIVFRGFRSWWLGVTSGLWFIPFVLTLCLLGATHHRFRYRLLAEGVGLLIGGGFGMLHYCRAIARSRHIPNEKDIQVSTAVRDRVGTQLSESDDPIESWAEDTLGRAALIDSLSVKLLISKAPVIALFGEFGSGKTSILNLLGAHLRGKAIVVSFSTWLPGSQETLTSYLMADIANECQKHYMVPGLRKSAGRLANALSQSVPFLKGYPELFPAPTQRDDIENLKRALMRLPQRVVVLLDELDRMERNELLPLLKVVRGISSLPNLSFVCAAERRTLTSTVCGDNADNSNLYFEKFFPSSVAVPKEDSGALQNAGVERVIAALRHRGWFEDEQEVTELRIEFEAVWPLRIAPLVKNLRAIGLLANDVGIAAAPLRRQVDPVDLTFIELIRRFKPAVYDIIAGNSLTLTGGDHWLRGGSYHSDEEKKLIKTRLLEDLKAASADDAQFDQLRGTLGEMFPAFASEERFQWDLRPKRKDKEADERRISNPGMFPAYFRYDLPAAIYSAVELETFVRRSEEAATDSERKLVFSDGLHSMEKGSLKRDDFLRKLAKIVTSVSPKVGRGWIEAVMIHAKDLTYDMMSGFGEAGHIFRMVLQFALKLPKPQRLALLEKCIEEASDDTMAFRLLTTLTAETSGFHLEISLSDLYPSFIRRMRQRYGRKCDAENADITTSDAGAFNLWGMQVIPKHNITADPDDRALQYDFWRRYIGNSRLRLVHSFGSVFLPPGLVDGPTESFVENKLDLGTIRRLYELLPRDEELNEFDKKSENKLRRFLRGDFKNGVGFDDLEEAESDEDRIDHLATPVLQELTHPETDSIVSS